MAGREQYSTPPLHSTAGKKKTKDKRRFNDEQIKYLESIFKSDSKLEPIKKLQLARELGLQPRQVAIWFQNRRARWKSKQMEQDYRVLKANYDHLSSQFESLKKEKQFLLMQLRKLNELLEKVHDEDKRRKDAMENVTDGAGSDLGVYCEFKSEANCLLKQGSEHGMAMSSEDDLERGNVGYLGQEEEEDEKWCNFDDSTGGFGHSSGSSNWWEFWS